MEESGRKSIVKREDNDVEKKRKKKRETKIWREKRKQAKGMERWDGGGVIFEREGEGASSPFMQTKRRNSWEKK